MKYVPKTGRNARKRNEKRIEKYLRENPEATGVEISKALKLGLKAVYSHLEKYRK